MVEGCVDSGRGEKDRELAFGAFSWGEQRWEVGLGMGDGGRNGGRLAGRGW